MTEAASKSALIADLDRAAQETFAYFESAGRTTDARVDRWHARDVLQHFIYFHDATAWGMQSAAQGGPPWLLPADADTINEVWRRLHAHESVEELLGQLRQAHARLMRAAREVTDLEAPCLKNARGEVATVRQRLERIAKHWREHVQELQTAAAAR